MRKKHSIDNKRKLVKAGYNQCAQMYSSSRDMFASQRYLERLAKLLVKGANILDAGCGCGIPIDKYILEQGFNVTGIDISGEQIKSAKRNLPQGHFLVKDMGKVDFPSNSFDAIVSFYAIFHVPREEHPALLKKFYNLLKPAGYLLITMGSAAWEGTQEDFHGAKMFWSHFGTARNKELVKQAGFEIILERIDTSAGERHLVILARKK